jgi:hypothetical protein
MRPPHVDIDAIDARSDGHRHGSHRPHPVDNRCDCGQLVVQEAALAGVVVPVELEPDDEPDGAGAEVDDEPDEPDPDESVEDEDEEVDDPESWEPPDSDAAAALRLSVR